MYWTLELASSLDDAPWPATKEELIDYANRSGAPEEVIENLEELDEDGDIYLYEYSEDEDGQPILGDIDDDDVFEAVCDRFDEICDEEDFDELVPTTEA